MTESPAARRRPSPVPRPAAPASTGAARTVPPLPRLTPTPAPPLLRADGRGFGVTVGLLVAVVVAAVVAVAAVCVQTLGAGAGAAELPLPPAYRAQQVSVGAPAPTAAPAAQPAPAAVPPNQPMARGDWTPEIGRQIAERALRWLDWPYSFGGGNADGPTYGVAVDADSRNDPHVRGFDCSGLVLYALTPWRQLTHLASAQYVQSGRWHPALNSLAPGDLVFWSTDGTIGGVEHVAIYVGGGKVVQAPRSGARITITPIAEVRAGVVGTVRPLS